MPTNFDVVQRYSAFLLFIIRTIAFFFVVLLSHKYRYLSYVSFSTILPLTTRIIANASPVFVVPSTPTLGINAIFVASHYVQFIIFTRTEIYCPWKSSFYAHLYSSSVYGMVVYIDMAFKNISPI